MKRILLLLLAAFFLSLASKAQKKKISAADQAAIENTLKESEKRGVSQWEREKLKKLLYKKYSTPADQKIIPAQVNSACTNANFENGNYNGWVLTSGNINGVTLPCYTCATGTGGIAHITTISNSGPTWSGGIDNCTNLPVLAPNGGNYSLALNDVAAGGKLMEIRYAFAVTSGNAHFTLRYLVILQDGMHPPTDQPYYMYRFLDGSGNEIPGTLHSAYSSSTSTWTPAPNCPGTNYLGWTSDCIELGSYVGQTVTLQFQVSDCNQGGHYGYAYIDASCMADAPMVYMCSGSNTQQIIAPAGFSTYQWYGPNSSSTAIPAPNGTNDTLTIVNGQVGDVYYLKDSMNTANGCYGKDSVTLQITNPAWVNYSGTHAGLINDTGTIYLCQGDTLVLKAGGVSTFTWSSGVTDGTAFYPTSSGTYTLAAVSSPGCTDSVIVHTVVQPCGTTGVSSNAMKNELDIYPNPSRGNFTVRAKNKIDEIRISDMTGRIVYECRPGSLTAPLQLESDGIYFVQVRSENKLSNLKLVVSK